MEQTKHTVKTIQEMRNTFKQYAEEVRNGSFPGEEHSYKMSDEVMETIEKKFD